MAYKRTIQRGGGKKKALLSEVYLPDSLDGMDIEEIDVLFKTVFKTLETYLAECEETSEAILKKHDQPTPRQVILPINVSYADDILFSVHEVREFIKKGDAHNAAAAGIRLGRYVARAEAEQVAGGRESGRTSNARVKNEAKAKARRTRMKAIAEELFNWKPDIELTKQQRRKVNKALLLEYVAGDRPTSSDMTRDAENIGLKRKKST